jgi:hypothetical protein
MLIYMWCHKFIPVACERRGGTSGQEKSDKMPWLIWRDGQRYAREYLSQQYLYG